MAIDRIYVEKRPEHAVEAGAVLSDLRSVQGIANLKSVRILNRYDVAVAAGGNQAHKRRFKFRICKV